MTKEHGGERVQVIEQAAMAKIRKELGAASPEALLKVNVDVIGTVVQFRIMLAPLRELLPSMVAALRAFDPSELDKLERFASALSAAQVAHSNATIANGSLASLAKEGKVLRTQMLEEVKARNAHRLVSKKAVSKLRGGNAYRHIAKDLLQLVEFSRLLNTMLQDDSVGTDVVLNRAECVANQLIDKLRKRREPSAELATAALDLRRAFTLFSRSYVEVRRVVLFARFYEGDADRLMPPLSTAQKGRKRKPREKAEPQGEEIVSSKSVTAEAPPQIAAKLDASSDPEQSSNGKLPIGFPGSDPFRD